MIGINVTFYILQKGSFPFQCLQYIQQTAVSLHRRRNLTSVSNVCEAAPMSLSWAPKGLNELPLQWANHDAYSNPGTQVGSQEQGFRRCFADGVNQSIGLCLRYSCAM